MERSRVAFANSLCTHSTSWRHASRCESVRVYCACTLYVYKFCVYVFVFDCDLLDGIRENGVWECFCLTVRPHEQMQGTPYARYTHYNCLRDAVVNIARKEGEGTLWHLRSFWFLRFKGIRGFFRGAQVTVIGTVPTDVLYYGVFEREIEKKRDRKKRKRFRDG